MVLLEVFNHIMSIVDSKLSSRGMQHYLLGLLKPLFKLLINMMLMIIF